MGISAALGIPALKPGVCTSTTRPAAPYEGQLLYETDTDSMVFWDGTIWENVATRKNLLYNGAMQIAQRGTSTASITGSGYYTADRWRTAASSQGTWTQAVVSTTDDYPAGSGFRQSLKMTCTTAAASPGAGSFILVQQFLEGHDLQSIRKGTSAAEQVTMSFWVRSGTTGTYIAELLDNDNTRQCSKSYTISAANTWEFKTITFPADTTGLLDNDNQASLFVNWWLGAGSNFTSGTLNTSWAASTSANRVVGQVNLASGNTSTVNYWQITGVQLNVGSTAAPFEHKSFGQELALCQRYYTRLKTTSSGSPGGYAGQGQARNGTAYTLFGAVPLNCTMRITPAIAVSGISAEPNAGGSVAMSTSIGSYPTQNNAGFYVTRSSGNWAADSSVMLIFDSTSSYIAADAEL